MKPIDKLPLNYQMHSTLDFSKRIVRNYLSILFTFLLLLPGFMIYILSVMTRSGPSIESALNFLTTFGLPIINIVVVLIVIPLVVLWTHELFYSASWWLFTGRLCHFSIESRFLVAKPPNLYTPRKHYLLVRSVPVLLFMLIGLILINVVPISLVAIAVFVLSIGIAASTADLMSIGWILSQPKDVLIHDNAAQITTFIPISESLHSSVIMGSG